MRKKAVMPQDLHGKAKAIGDAFPLCPGSKNGKDRVEGVRLRLCRDFFFEGLVDSRSQRFSQVHGSGTPLTVNHNAPEPKG